METRPRFLLKPCSAGTEGGRSVVRFAFELFVTVCDGLTDLVARIDYALGRLDVLVFFAVLALRVTIDLRPRLHVPRVGAFTLVRIPVVNVLHGLAP